MQLPFTIEEFLGVFVAYNDSIWPAQVVLNAAALIAVALCFRPKVPSRIISAILGILWLWTGIVYHLEFFLKINPAALVFGILCIVQGAILLGAGGFGGGLKFQYISGLKGYAGGALLLYGLLIYPVLGYMLGHRYPAAPTFGAPCPTTIFTFGILLWSASRVKWYYYLLPLIWSLIGFTAALNLGMYEDFGLLAAAIIGTIIMATDRETRTTEGRE